LIAPGLIIHFHNYSHAFRKERKIIPTAPPSLELIIILTNHGTNQAFSSEVLHGIQSKQHMEVMVLYYQL
jgi:hypothetical protein